MGHSCPFTKSSYPSVPQYTLSSFPHFTFVLQCTLVYPFQFPTLHIRTLVNPSVPFLVSHTSHSYSSVPQCTLSSLPHFTFVLQCTPVYPFQFPTFHIRTLVYPSVPFLVSHISHSYSSVPQCTLSSFPHFTFVLQCTLVYPFQFPTFHIRTLVYPSIPFLVSHISHSYSSVPQCTLSSFPPLVSPISHSYSRVPQCTLSSFPHFTFVLQCTLVYPFQFPTLHIRTLVYPSVPFLVSHISHSYSSVYPSVPFLVSHISHSYSSVPQCTLFSFPHFTFVLQCTPVYPFQFPTFHFLIRTLVYPSVPFLVSHISHSYSSVPQCTLSSFPHFTFVLQCTLVYPFQFPTFHIRTLVYPSAPFLVSHISHPYSSVPQYTLSSFPHFTFVLQCTLVYPFQFSTSSFPHFTFVLSCTLVYPFQFPTFHIRALVYPSIPFLVSHISHSCSSVPQYTLSSFPHFTFVLQCTLVYPFQFPHFTFVLQCTLVYPFQFPTFHIRTPVYPSVPFLVSHISHSYSSVPQCTLSSCPHFTFVLQCTLVYPFQFSTSSFPHFTLVLQCTLVNPFQFPTFHIRTLVYPSVSFLVSTFHIRTLVYPSVPFLVTFPTFHIRTLVYPSVPFLVSHISHSYSSVPQCTLSSFPHFTFVLQCTLVYPFQFSTSSFPHFTFVLSCTLVYPFQFPTFHIRTLVYPSIPFLVPHISHSYTSVPQCALSSFPHFTFVLQCTLVYPFQFPTSSFPHFTFVLSCTLVYPFQFPTFHIRTLVYPSVPFLVSHTSHSYSSVPQCTLSSFPHFTFLLQCTPVSPFQFPTFHIRTLVYPSVPFLVSHTSHSYSSVPQCTLSSFPHFTFVLQCTPVYPFQFPTFHIRTLVYPSVPFLVSHISHSYSSVPQCTLSSFPHFTFVLQCTLVHPFQFPTFHIRTLVYPSIPFLVSHISHSYSSVPQCTLSSFPPLVSHISHSYSRVPQCTLSSFPHFTFVLQCTLVYPFQFPTFHIRTLVYPSVPFLVSHISHSYSSVHQCALSSFPHFTFVLQCTLVYPFQFPTLHIRTLVYPSVPFLVSHISHSYSCILVYPSQFPTFHVHTLVYPSVPFLVSHISHCTLVYPSVPFLVSHISHSYSSVPQCTLSSFPHFTFVLQCTLVHPFQFPTFHIRTLVYPSIPFLVSHISHSYSSVPQCTFPFVLQCTLVPFLVSHISHSYSSVPQCTLSSFPHFTFVLQCTLVYPFQFPTFHIRTLVYPSVPFLVSHISHSYSSVPQCTLSSFPHFTFVLQCTLVYPFQFPTFHIRTLVYPSVPFLVSHISHSYSSVPQYTLSSFPHFTFVLQCTLVYPFQFPTFHIHTLVYPSVPFLVSHISHSYSSVPQCTLSSFPHFTFVLQCTLVYPFQFPTFHIRTLVYPSVPFLVSHISHSYSSVPQCTLSSFPHFTFVLQCTLAYPFQFPTFHIHALVYPSVPFLVSHISHSCSSVPQCTLCSFPHFTFVLWCTLVYPFQFPTFHIRTLVYPSDTLSSFPHFTFVLQCTLVYPFQFPTSSFPHFTFVLSCTLVYPFQFPTFHIRTLVYPSVPFLASHISHSYSSVPQCTLSSFPHFTFVLQCTLVYPFQFPTYSFPHFTFVLQCTLVYPFQFPTFHIRTLVYPSVPFLVSHFQFPTFHIRTLVYPSVPFLVSHISHSYSSVPQCTLSSFPHFTFVLQCTLVYPFQFPTFHIRTLVYPSVPFPVSHISHSYSGVPQYTPSSFPHFIFVLSCTLVYPFQFPTFHIRTLVYPSVPFLVSHISHSYSSVPQYTLSSFPHFTFVLQCTLVYPFQFPTSSFPHFTFVLSCTLVYPFQFPTFHIRTLVYPSVPFLASHISHSYSSVPQCTLSSFPHFTFVLQCTLVYPFQFPTYSFPHFTFVLQCTLVYPFQFPTFHIRTLVYPSVPFLVSHFQFPTFHIRTLVYPSIPFLVSHISHSYSSVPQCTLSSFPHFTFVLQCTLVYHFLVSHISHSYSSVSQCTLSSFPHFSFVLWCTLVYPFQFPTFHIRTLVYPSIPFLVSHISHSYSSVHQCALSSFPHFTFVLQCRM